MVDQKSMAGDMPKVPMSVSFDTPRNPHFIEVTRQFLMEMPIAQHLGFDITDVGLGRFRNNATVPPRTLF
jgi:hypothetical protein